MPKFVRRFEGPQPFYTAQPGRYPSFRTATVILYRVDSDRETPLCVDWPGTRMVQRGEWPSGRVNFVFETTEAQARSAAAPGRVADRVRAGR